MNAPSIENYGGDIVKGMAAGLIGGLVAAAVMNQFQKLIGPFLTGDERSHGAQSLQQGSPSYGIGRMLAEKGMDNPDDDSAERLANAVSVAVTEHELTEEEKDLGGTLFHYGFGGSMGAIYGAAVEHFPKVGIGMGLPYGALIWASADEGVVPLIGISKTPDKYPPSVHFSALASHLVYGLALEGTRRAVRKMF
jgi:putative membrane protein